MGTYTGNHLNGWNNIEQEHRWQRYYSIHHGYSNRTISIGMLSTFFVIVIPPCTTVIVIGTNMIWLMLYLCTSRHESLQVWGAPWIPHGSLAVSLNIMYGSYNKYQKYPDQTNWSMLFPQKSQIDVQVTRNTRLWHDSNKFHIYRVLRGLVSSANFPIVAHLIRRLESSEKKTSNFYIHLDLLV